ncbi:MAG: hypothetical protein ACO3AV_12700, partial [Ilumatobacteraceae bacterium]
MTDTTHSARAASRWARLDPAAVRLDDLRAAMALPSPRPAHAVDVQLGVPVYDAVAARNHIAAHGPLTLLDELAAVLAAGAGIFVIKGAFDHEVLRPVTRAFEEL